MRQWCNNDLNHARVRVSPRGSFVYCVSEIDYYDDGHITLLTFTITHSNEYKKPVPNFRLYNSFGVSTIDDDYLRVIGI